MSRILAIDPGPEGGQILSRPNCGGSGEREMSLLKTFTMEALIDDFYTKKDWYEVLDFMFHTTGEYPMVTVWLPKIKGHKTFSFFTVKGFRIKK
jgi:hypothetical protein